MIQTARVLALPTALILLGIAGPSPADDDAAAGAERRAEKLERYDADGDGKLSDSERAAAREARGQRGDGSRKKKRQQRWDTDGDGQVSDAERAAAKDERQKDRAGMRQKYDSDGDGRLSQSERDAARADGARVGGRGGQKKGQPAPRSEEP